MKKCVRCKKINKSEFNQCEKCRKHIREYRKKNNNIVTRRYEKTINGFLVRMYRNMSSRVLGIQHKKAHLYLGLEILPKDDFYKWAKQSNDFIKMFKKWEIYNYDRRLTPTVDRIDTSIGYIIKNMQWLTHSENSRKGTISKNAIYHGKDKT